MNNGETRTPSRLTGTLNKWADEKVEGLLQWNERRSKWSRVDVWHAWATTKHCCCFKADSPCMSLTKTHTKIKKKSYQNYIWSSSYSIIKLFALWHHFHNKLNKQSSSILPQHDPGHFTSYYPTGWYIYYILVTVDFSVLQYKYSISIIHF